MNFILNLAAKYQETAWKVVADTEIVSIWKFFGAEVNLVGSLKTGLLINNRDIDFHIYSEPFRLSDSFGAIAKLAENPRIKKITYANLLDTQEICLEWHAWYQDDEDNLWQIDLIHLRKDSPYAGKFERVAERILAVLTDETKEAILTIKNSAPPGQKVIGIEVYQAVIRDGIRNYQDFISWRTNRDRPSIIEWEP